MTDLSTLFPDVSVQDVYTPAMMEYDGSTGYYGKSSITYSGSSVTLIARFNCNTFTGDTIASIARAKGGASAYTRIYAYLGSSDHTDTDYRDKLIFQCMNNSGTVICELISTIDLTDGEDHIMMASYNGTTGVATLIVDGVDVDDTGASGRILTTGTLATSPGLFSVASANNSSLVLAKEIQVGFLGYADAYLTNWSDFMHINGSPIKQDESTWANSGWGSQPLFWNEHGFMEDNRGSAGDMTKNGTINIADTEVVT